MLGLVKGRRGRRVFTRTDEKDRTFQDLVAGYASTTSDVVALSCNKDSRLDLESCQWIICSHPPFFNRFATSRSPRSSLTHPRLTLPVIDLTMTHLQMPLTRSQFSLTESKSPLTHRAFSLPQLNLPLTHPHLKMSRSNLTMTRTNPPSRELVEPLPDLKFSLTRTRTALTRCAIALPGAPSGPAVVLPGFS